MDINYAKQLDPHLVRPMNIIEPNEMMDMIIDFLNLCKEKYITVGGICGSPLMRIVLDACTTYTSFDKVLVVDGCTDYVYMNRNSKVRIPNHVPYKNLFMNRLSDEFSHYDPFSLRRDVSQKPHCLFLDGSYIDKYDVMVISNAQLIPKTYLKHMIDNFRGAVIVTCDPFDINGETYLNVPTIIRSVNKVPPIIGMARRIWGVETDMINKQAKGGVFNGTIRRSSIGTLLDRMYVTKDEMLLENVRAKQNMKNIHKNQKFVITDDRIHVHIDEEGFRHHIGYGDILISGAQNVNAVRNIFRVYQSNMWLYMNLKRDTPPKSEFEVEGCTIHQMKALPANIIDLNVASLHRMNNTVFIQTDGFITSVREMYMLMKNSVSLTVCKVKS